MPDEGTAHSRTVGSLLDGDEPQPVAVINASASTPILLVCDHASRRFPVALGTMGLDPVARRCHLAWDIGAGALTERIAHQLGVTAVLCQYSRLIVDCNRQLMDPGAFLEFGDGIVIPGNRSLKKVARESRAAEIYWPYHKTVGRQVQRLCASGQQPVFLSIHSFTPVLNGEARPWQMGFLWDADPTTSGIFMHDMRSAGYVVGDNEPYSGKALQDFTVDHHAEPVGLPHVGIEIRQDLISDADGVAMIGDVLCKTIESLSARMTPTKLDGRVPSKRT